MSGFAAFLQRDGQRASRAVLQRQAAVLRDAVPDATAGWLSGPVAQVQAFLATRDGASAGPHAAGALRLAGDIRLDDRLTLAAALRDAGVAVPNGDDDDALVLAAYLAWGERCAEHLRGEFSFALWDGARQQLFVARDGLGVRPLFFADVADAFVCANHIDAVRAHPAVSARLHDAALVSFLRWGWNVDVHRSAFADIHRLEAGHAMVVPLAGPTRAAVAHWTFPTPAPLRLRDERGYVDGYREVLASAVRDRLRTSAVSLQLSGGLDSTSLAATVRRIAPSVALKGFTYSAESLFDDPEAAFASEVARHLGMAHELDASPWMPLRHLEDSAFRTPEPIDDADYPHTRGSLARMAEHARVLFVGDDGDTLFAPPGIALMARDWGAMETVRRTIGYIAAHHRLPVLGLHLRDRLAGRPIERVYDPPPHWVRGDVLARTGPQDFVEPPLHPTRPGTKWLRGAYWQTGMETDSFAYVRLPMEWRWPLLDTRVIAYVLSVPPIPWCQRKELVRASFAGELPLRTLRRPKTVLPSLPPIVARRWMAQGRPGLAALGGAIGEYVDLAVLDPIFKGEDAAAVPGAWRALFLAQWLGAAERMTTGEADASFVEITEQRWDGAE